MKAKSYQPRAILRRKTKYVCKVCIQSHKNPILVDCKRQNTFITGSGEPGLDYAKSIVSIGS